MQSRQINGSHTGTSGAGHGPGINDQCPPDGDALGCVRVAAAETIGTETYMHDAGCFVLQEVFMNQPLELLGFVRTNDLSPAS